MATRSKRRSNSAAPSHDAAKIRLKIIPARDATPIKTLLVYARNKVGKTRLAASAGAIGRTLLIDCEEGSASIRKAKNVDVYKLTTWDEINEIYWYLRTQDHGYEFVCIDPVTKLGALCMEWVLAQDIDPEDEDAAAERDSVTPDQRSWGKTGALMRRTILRYCTLPGVFLILTAYEKRREADDDGDDEGYDYVIGPDAQPSVKGFLMGQVDIIGRLYIKAMEDEEDGNAPAKIERRMLFGPHEIYDCGDRSDNLPRVMRRPTMKKILDIVNEEQPSGNPRTSRR